MNGLKDLVGRKFRFERSSSGAVVPTAELPSATWFHSDGMCTANLTSRYQKKGELKMALVKCKNPDLYRSWLDYLERASTLAPYEIRTRAFFESQAGNPVPLS